MKIMNKIYKLLVITSLLFLSSDVYSELVIKVTQGNDKPTEIAISPIESVKRYMIKILD